MTAGEAAAEVSAELTTRGAAQVRLSVPRGSRQTANPIVDCGWHGHRTTLCRLHDGCSIGSPRPGRLWRAITNREGEDFQDYDIHELLHLKYRDHGKQFKAIMTALVPNWRELEQSSKVLNGAARLEVHDHGRRAHPEHG